MCVGMVGRVNCNIVEFAYIRVIFYAEYIVEHKGYALELYVQLNSLIFVVIYLLDFSRR